MKNKKTAERTPARKLNKDDLKSIAGQAQVLILGCCTQGCCDEEILNDL